MKQSFLKECERFDACVRQPGSAAFSQIGLVQFFEYESRGIRPDDPDPYFVLLLDGKKWWEWTLNNIADQFFGDNWPGWYCLAIDWLADPIGFKQLRQRLGFEPLTPAEVIKECESEHIWGVEITSVQVVER